MHYHYFTLEQRSTLGAAGVRAPGARKNRLLNLKSGRGAHI
jgi:hypothetical protein